MRSAGLAAHMRAMQAPASDDLVSLARLTAQGFDKVDTALAKYRAENKITDMWEARERVVVAVTGGPESETLVRRASRIASKSSAELMVVHVIRGDGLAGMSERTMGKVRELANSLDASLHTVVGDDVPTALLDFARENNATQLVIGTSRRPRWARIFEEGVAQTIVERSGKIDVHMVTHEESKRGLRMPSLSPRAPKDASECLSNMRTPCLRRSGMRAPPVVDRDVSPSA